MSTPAQITEKNFDAIESRIQRITGENRMSLEGGEGTEEKYFLDFWSKKDYAARSWDSSRTQIKSYLEGLYPGYTATVFEAPEETEYEWGARVKLTK